MSAPQPYTPETVADALLSVLDEAASRSDRATLAIPGGRSPGPTLTALARLCPPGLRARLHLLWVDERGVPPGHPERNDLPTLAAWRAGGELPAFVHPMPAEAEDLQLAAERYALTLQEATDGSSLDAVLLGIGEDGHIASLFPNHPGLSELSDVFAIFDSPKPPPRRLSVSLGVLRRAAHLAILALGAAKGPIVRRAAAAPDRAIPVSLLPPERSHWYVDDAAVQAAADASAYPRRT